MGLTIHWHHEIHKGGKTRVNKALNVAKNLAKTICFKEVGDIIHVDDPDKIKAILEDYDHSHRWIAIQASMYHDVQRTNGHNEYTSSYTVLPKEFFALTLSPGEGCESMELIFAKYPGLIEVEVDCPISTWRRGKKKTKQVRQRTGLAGRWLNRSFCKTTYSKQPVACHLRVCAILRMIEQFCDVHEVRDESDFYETRNIEMLTQEFKEDHEMLASFAGVLFDSEVDVHCPISENPDFEVLEHRGRQNDDVDNPID